MFTEDKTIKIWKSPYNLIKTLNGHTDSVYSILQLKHKEIFIFWELWGPNS